MRTALNGATLLAYNENAPIITIRSGCRPEIALRAVKSAPTESLVHFHLLLPDAPDACLEARLWDRFFELYVSPPMQKFVTDRIRPQDGKDPVGVADMRGQRWIGPTQ